MDFKPQIVKGERLQIQVYSLENQIPADIALRVLNADGDDLFSEDLCTGTNIQVDQNEISKVCNALMQTIQERLNKGFSPEDIEKSLRPIRWGRFSDYMAWCNYQKHIDGSGGRD